MDDDEGPAPWTMDVASDDQGLPLPDPTTRDAVTRSEMRGLEWECLRDVLTSPSRAQPIILKLACHLADLDRNTTTVQAAAAHLKTNEVAILEAISLMPTLFKIRSAGHSVILTRPGDDPSVESPRRRKEREARDRAASKANAREAARASRDAQDTPFNALRVALEALGLDRPAAREFAGHITRTYGHSASFDAVSETARCSPAEPKSYVIAILKRRLAAAAIGLPTRIPATTRPAPTRDTLYIGWSATEPRQKLYRRPDGTLKRLPPAPGEHVPSLAQDPGFLVAS